MKHLSRRRLLGLLGAGMMMPRRLQADGGNSRKFLFIYVQGGWDPTWVFAPVFGSPNVWIDPQGTQAELGGIPFVDAASRPSVRRYFEQYAGRTAIINGMEIRSVTHERCRRLLMTGSSGDQADDWPSQLASPEGYRLPYLVLSGPSYTNRSTARVVRVGSSGQLSALMDGSVLSSNEPPEPLPSPTTEALMQSFLASRIEAFPAAAGRPTQFKEALQTSLSQAEVVEDLAQALAQANVGTSFTPVSERAEPAIRCFEQGFSRCAMVEHAGQFDLGWDSHSGLEMQATHFEVLFSDLIAILQELDQRRGPTGNPLSEEVTVVVLSEMGRTPTMNTTGGKDHWTFTSAILIGAGVRGGQVLGSYDPYLLGTPVDLQAGGPGESLLSSEHLGATLLALADLDPGGVPVMEVLLG